MAEFTIRPATTSDVGALASLHAAAVAKGYRHIFPSDSPSPSAAELTAGWDDLLDRANTMTSVAVDGDAVIGSVVLSSDADVPSGLLIKRLHVDPHCWGQGLGSQLHDHAVAQAMASRARKINLWVLEGNSRARSMYERRGWKLCEPRRIFANEPATIVDVLYERALP